MWRGLRLRVFTVSGAIGGNPAEWHPRTARAVLALVAKIEHLEEGQGWQLDDTRSVWRTKGDVFLLREVGMSAWPGYASPSSIVTAWLEKRDDFDHDDPRPEDLPPTDQEIDR